MKDKNKGKNLIKGTSGGPEMVNPDISEETKELIKIFVTSIKTAIRQTHGPERSRRAEKKKK